MDSTKPATQSLTIQAVVVTLAVVAYSLVAKTFFPDLPDIPDAVLQLLTGSGLLVAGYGRVRATTQIGTPTVTVEGTEKK